MEDVRKVVEVVREEMKNAVEGREGVKHDIEVVKDA